MENDALKYAVKYKIMKYIHKHKQQTGGKHKKQTGGQVVSEYTEFKSTLEQFNTDDILGMIQKIKNEIESQQKEFKEFVSETNEVAINIILTKTETADVEISYKNRYTVALIRAICIGLYHSFKNEGKTGVNEEEVGFLNQALNTVYAAETFLSNHVIEDDDHNIFINHLSIELNEDILEVLYTLKILEYMLRLCYKTDDDNYSIENSKFENNQLVSKYIKHLEYRAKEIDIDEDGTTNTSDNNNMYADMETDDTGKTTNLTRHVIYTIMLHKYYAYKGFTQSDLINHYTLVMKTIMSLNSELTATALWVTETVLKNAIPTKKRKLTQQN